MLKNDDRYVNNQCWPFKILTAADYCKLLNFAEEKIGTQLKYLTQ